MGTRLLYKQMGCEGGMKVRPSLNDIVIMLSQASVSGWLALTMEG